MSTITVKPLVWRDYTNTPYLSVWETEHCGTILFEINRYDDDPMFHLSKRRTRAPSTPYPTLAAAQEAAQKEWADFIRAAVEETP